MHKIDGWTTPLRERRDLRAISGVMISETDGAFVLRPHGAARTTSFPKSRVHLDSRNGAMATILVPLDFLIERAGIRIMTDRPIIFSAPMVRALLDGRKTQTRRLMPGQKYLEGAYQPIVSGPCIYNYSGDEMISRTPYAPGDRLWVRETVRASELPSGADGVRYVATDDWIGISPTPEGAERWCDLHAYRGKRGATVPPIHMPRWASRLTLIVEGVKVERLQEITEADSIAEGAPPLVEPSFIDGGRMVEITPGIHGTPRTWFRLLWENINGGGAWDANPWVVAISFRVVKANIDTMAA